ncbi:MAG: hypothetical protein M1817_001276 [Caeruleum heppii]|nr:MAG: hypothetical protein M1817_001276 [Caeruleum heppii]
MFGVSRMRNAASKTHSVEAIAGNVRPRSTISETSSTLIERHNAAVQKISATVKQFYDRKEKFRIFHGSTNSTRPSTLRGNRVVDISSLSHVLKIDVDKRTALVEPNVPMDRLVEAALGHGLVPPVVMEFPGITVGGGYAGTSGESSSFKHGFFDRTIIQVEMVLASGDVVTCSDNERPDLFHGAAGAVGTLGVTTLVELKLQKAKRFVETMYQPVSSVSEAVEVIKKATEDESNDYVDGIIFSKNLGAVITGRLTDHVAHNLPVQHFSAARDPWFYLHVKDKIEKGPGPIKEVIPLAEYLFRYDRGGFWVGASAFKYFGVPFNRFTRWFLDDFLHTRMMYTALHASGHSKRYVVQDLALPYATAEEFMAYTDESFGIYPLWLCPLRESPAPSMHPHILPSTKVQETPRPMLNIGLWGQGPSRHQDCVQLNINLEHKLRELGGMKWLYAHTYYPEEEFWQMHDRDWYDALRHKYDATSLPNVYEKVRVDLEAERKAARSSTKTRLLDRWPFSGLYGLKKAIESGTYHAARNSTWKAKRGSYSPSEGNST